MRRFRLLLELVGAFAGAWRVRIEGHFAHLRLPPVRARATLSEDDIAFADALTGLLILFGARQTGRKCFFRSYTLAKVLRAHGVNVDLNVGLKRGADGSSMTGHSWLSLPDGTLFREPAETVASYPVLLDRRPDGVRFWVGDMGRANQPPSGTQELRKNEREEKA